MSGLSWLTVLRKRENFRRAFDEFDPEKIARYGAREVARLMADEGIIRNRAKIDATINNARRLLELVDESSSFAGYVWRYEPRPRRRLPSRAELRRATTAPEAIEMSQDLRRRGWQFVGPVTVYSFMQAMGLVNDHVRGCAARLDVERARREFQRPG